MTETILKFPHFYLATKEIQPKKERENSKYKGRYVILNFPTLDFLFAI